MTNKQETVADIVREMREMPKDYIVDANANFVFRRYAERIEAAHKREAERLREALRDCMENMCERCLMAHMGQCNESVCIPLCMAKAALKGETK